MADSLLQSAWPVGLMGFAVSGTMYGATLAQSFYYTRYFPQDSTLLKCLVLGIFLADTGHLIGSAQYYWATLVLSHRQQSTSLDGLTWGLLVMMILDIFITFTVQCFYCYRVWIISGKNKILTGIVFVAAIMGVGSGIWICVTTILTWSLRFALTSPLILPLAGMNTLGDFVITGTVFKYMWKSGFRKKRSAIRDLAVIFINLGVFTCILSTVLGVLYLAQGNGYLVSAVGVTLSRSYVNSMLAVLNARKRIRDRTAAITFELSGAVYSFA